MDTLIEVVEPQLIGRGFERDGVLFRRFSELDDCVLVEFQSAQAATTGAFRFYLNIGLVLQRWLEWKAAQSVGESSQPIIDDAQLWSRLHDPNAEQFRDDWRVDLKPADISEASVRIIARLEVALDSLSRYLDRTRLLAALRSGEDLGLAMVNRRTAKALLLIERGQSDELAHLLESMRARGSQQAALADWIWRSAHAG